MSTAKRRLACRRARTAAFLTAIHFLHLLIGFVVLGVVVHQLWSPARRSQELVETGATYWHTIDFLWVIIFSLLYVMR